jgi:xylulokinase
MSLMGIDVGTSGCKSALFSEDGQLLSLAYEEYDFQHPQPGWAELDVPATWNLVKKTIRKAAGEARNDPIRGISVSSMGEAVVPVTATGGILGPSLLNFDTRGDEFLPELTLTMPV